VYHAVERVWNKVCILTGKNECDDTERTIATPQHETRHYHFGSECMGRSICAGLIRADMDHHDLLLLLCW